MGGRPKDPTGAKILRGTWRADRANPYEPESDPIEGIPEPPRRLKGPARKEWDRVIGFIVRNRITGAEGLSLVATYCNLHAAIVTEEKKGLIPTASLLAQYRALADAFGLTGSSRAKLHTPKKQAKANPWEVLKNA